VALAWLTTRTHYSGVGLPMGGTRGFRRDWTLARVSRRDVVAAQGVATGRKWLRSPQGIAYRPELVLAEVEDLGLPPLPPNVSPQMKEAFSSWRRAAEEADPLAAVVALWESVEFYVSGVSVDDLFSKQQRRAVRRAAAEGLEGEQLDRVWEVVGRLNEAPLMVRLREALRQDNVTYTEAEISLLRKLRNLRNDFGSDGELLICRSWSATRTGAVMRETTKTGKGRPVSLPEATAAMSVHRTRYLEELVRYRDLWEQTWAKNPEYRDSSSRAAPAHPSTTAT
jgi:hypothetical protein